MTISVEFESCTIIERAGHTDYLSLEPSETNGKTLMAEYWDTWQSCGFKLDAPKGQGIPLARRLGFKEARIIDVESGTEYIIPLNAG